GGVWQDVHGAGAQRSDPKTGDPSRFPQGRGPQGDAIRIYNDVRLVRGGNVTTDVRQSGSMVTPDNFALQQNYPNPFNPTTIITYQLPKSSFVTLQLFDLLGREIRVLVDGMREAGFHEVSLDASRLASGTYFYRLQAGSFIETKKLVLLR
ncbi:MAG: T9SS type A sorting domain-containing protein, partial [Ignavibacteriae bacterium]|nr:T9SS type A sorting domain-containing protein [Ignavibacteriota bacterium]